MRFRIPDSEVRKLVARLTPSRDGMERVAVLLNEQVQERFDTQGASGGTPWPAKRDGGPALIGIDKTYRNYADERSATVAATHSFAAVHHKGTVGKGGSEPTIKPVRAKALFIPLTDRARAAYDASRGGGDRPLRVVRSLDGTRLEPVNHSSTAFEGLIRGVDFIFASKVDLPPRPQLPTSAPERAAQATAVADAIRSKHD